jgi:hypothetical protein
MFVSLGTILHGGIVDVSHAAREICKLQLPQLLSRSIRPKAFGIKKIAVLCVGPCMARSVYLSLARPADVPLVLIYGRVE